MNRRPAHKSDHPDCPYPNWTKCDAAQAHQWGPCKAVIGDREPEPCTRWAVSDEGWCWQHYVSETERAKREERIAITKQELSFRLDAYIEMTKSHPSIWDRTSTPHAALTAAPVKRKGPHRLTSPA